MAYLFPKGFLWGAATASYQVEGGIENCDWAQAAREGKVPACGKATDHYNLYEKDFDLIKQLGHTCHRISIEWSRIEPEEGVFDAGAIEHYRKVLQALKDRGITPFITLWHFTLPTWFVEKGGFESGASRLYFSRYAEYAITNLGDLVHNWATINEPEVFAHNGWWRGYWPPFKRHRLFSFLKAGLNLVRCHNAAYKKMKAACPHCDIGIVKDNIYFYGDRNPWHKFQAAAMGWFWNRSILDLIRFLGGNFDSIGLNYYFRKKFGKAEDIAPRSDMGWELFPEGIYHNLIELKRYGVRLYVSEAGLADEYDTHRAWYIREQVKWVHKAIEDGADVLGYMYWSLLDNYEWAYGFTKRFGLIEIDYDTLERTIRPSAYEYAKICTNNGIIE